MQKFIRAAGAVLVLAIAGCGGNSTGDNPPPKATPTATATAPQETTASINGTDYTCEEAIKVDKCEESFQAAFDKYGENLDAYVNSGQLGPFNDVDVEAKAAMGLAACAIADNGGASNDYVEYALKFYDNDRTSFLPAYFEAGRSLCVGSIPELNNSGDTDGDGTIDEYADENYDGI